MSRLIRTFVAIRAELPPADAVDERPSPSLRTVLSDLSRMGRAVRPVDESQLHFTVKFLGPTHEEHLPEVIEHVTSAAQTEPPFRIELWGLGAFPNLRRLSVVWAGVRNPDPLMRLAEAVDGRLAALNFGRDKYPYRPHLTLARVKAAPPAKLRSLIEENPETAFDSIEVSELILFRSTLERGGAVYDVLHAAPLTG